MKTFLVVTILVAKVSASCQIEDALQTLTPGAQWVLNGNQYSDLNWLDGIQQKPAKAAIVQAIQDCQTSELARRTLKQQAKLDVKNTGLTQGQRLQALLVLLDLDQ